MFKLPTLLVINMTMSQLLAFGATYLLCDMYKHSVPSQQKKEWENSIKMHHGEVGILTACIGIISKSPNLTASGVSLMIHDLDDAHNWFTNDKRKLDVTY